MKTSTQVSSQQLLFPTERNDTMTRVAKFGEYGGPEVLGFEREDVPELGPGDVRVRMLALALNRSNALFRAGTYLVDAAFPSRIGTEGVGVIEALAPVNRCR